MTDTVLSGCNADKALWENKKPIADVISIVTGNRTEISGLSQEQSSATTTGATKTFYAEMENMVDLTMNVIQRLRPYATVTKNNELLSKIDYSKSDLDHGKQIDCINKCKIVLEQGLQYLSDATDYELTQEMLDTLQSSINGIALLSGNRDAIIGTRKTATDQIPELINRIRVQLTMLDDLVPALIPDEKFVQTYKNNRRIIDR